ncbi:hypothetical protein [Oceanobacillus salinisoli]|uniref:hypothetical protein n=1 Tax=Oceanobacillus salinisoli TaxID=2678611 RepID=UPI0012E1ACDD|nr:hypothetical protein [Oceanobacillus salinisoli]
MKKYYVSANTAEGFINHITTNLQNIKQIIILKHPSNTLKTAIIQDAVHTYKSNYDVEVLLSPLGKKHLDGIIIREKSLAIISNRIATTDIAGAIEIDCSLFIKHKPTLDNELQEKFKYHTEEAYKNFATGLKIHDDLEEIYINEMNFKRANELAEEFIQNLLQNENKQDRQAHTYHRFFGTNTADGVVNEIPNLIEGIQNVYYIKGRAGTGKSTFMKKIAASCEEYGYDVQVYYCSFDPNSLDMVLVRDLDFCIFDSTDPHEYFPNRDGEKTLDLYEKLVTPGTDEKYEEQITKVNNHYKSYMKHGIKELKKAGEYLDEYEEQFTFTEEEKNHIIEFINEQIIQ